MKEPMKNRSGDSKYNQSIPPSCRSAFPIFVLFACLVLIPVYITVSVSLTIIRLSSDY